VKLRKGDPDAARKDDYIADLERRISKARDEIAELKSIQELMEAARDGVPSEPTGKEMKAGDYATAMVQVMRESMIEADYSVLMSRFAEDALQNMVVHGVGMQGAFALVVDDYIDKRKSMAVGETADSAKDLFALAEGLDSRYADRAKDVSKNFGQVPIALRLLEPFVRRKNLEDVGESVTISSEPEYVGGAVIALLEDKLPSGAMHVEEGYDGCPFYAVPVTAGKKPVAYLIAFNIPPKEEGKDPTKRYAMVFHSFGSDLQKDYNALNLLYEQRKQLKALDHVAVEMKKAIGFLSE
jgi:hypothetical protein